MFFIYQLSKLNKMNNENNNIIKTILIIAVFSVGGFIRGVASEIGPKTKTIKLIAIGGICYYGYKYFIA